MRFPKSGALVIIEWEDASSHDAWADVEVAEKAAAHLSHARTVGWFKGVDDSCALLVCCASFEGQVIVQTATMYRIPIGCIKKITRLQAKEDSSK